MTEYMPLIYNLHYTNCILDKLVLYRGKDIAQK